MAKLPTLTKFKRQKFLVELAIEIRDGPINKKSIRDMINQEIKYLHGDDVKVRVRSVHLVNTFAPDRE